jgi:hypothetical protein
VTDALRAGPGSPQWHQAVTLLRESGTGDEYALLYSAREHLESGREYREVRPGVGFTRKVMEGVEREAGGSKRGLSTATLVAIGSSIVLVIVVGLIVYFSLPSRPDARGELDKLGSTYFVNEVMSEKFTENIPEQWKVIGSLPPLASDKGLRLGASVEGAPKGGGVVSAAGIPAEEPFALEVTLLTPAGGDDLVTQVFVSDRPDFSADRATSPHELVWSLQKGQGQVILPDGRVQGQRADLPASSEPQSVRFVIGQRVGTIEAGGKKIWEGEHELASDRPRFLGVRILRLGTGVLPSSVRVQSIRVLKPAKS